MGLYDRYRIAQSQQVAPYVGSNVESMIKVADVLQQRYDKALDTQDALDKALSTAQVAGTDQSLFNQMKEGYKKAIGDWAQRGDYENMGREVNRAAQQFAGEYAHFAENAKRQAEYTSGLQDLLKKGYLKDPNTVRQLQQASRKGYTGMKYDPQTGQFSNKFVGIDPAKEVDLMEFVNKGLEGIKASSTAGERIEVQGDYYVKRSEKGEVLKREKIDDVLYRMFQKDPEMRAFVDQKKMLASFDKDENWLKLAPVNIREQVIGEAKALNITPEQYLQREFQKDAEAQIWKAISDFGSKAAYEKIERGVDFEGLTEQARAADKRADKEKFEQLYGSQSDRVMNPALTPLLRDGKIEASVWDKIKGGFATLGKGEAEAFGAEFKRRQAESAMQRKSGKPDVVDTLTDAVASGLSLVDSFFSKTGATSDRFTKRWSDNFIKGFAPDMTPTQKKAIANSSFMGMQAVLRNDPQLLQKIRSGKATPEEKQYVYNKGVDIGKALLEKEATQYLPLTQTFDPKLRQNMIDAVFGSEFNPGYINTANVVAFDENGNPTKKTNWKTALEEAGVDLDDYKGKALSKYVGNAGELGPVNPYFKNGLYVDIPKDPKDPGAGSVRMLVELPTQGMAPQEQFRRSLAMEASKAKSGDPETGALPGKRSFNYGDGKYVIDYVPHVYLGEDGNYHAGEGSYRVKDFDRSGKLRKEKVYTEDLSDLITNGTK